MLRDIYDGYARQWRICCLTRIHGIAEVKGAVSPHQISPWSINCSDKPSALGLVLFYGSQVLKKSLFKKLNLYSWVRCDFGNVNAVLSTYKTAIQSSQSPASNGVDKVFLLFKVSVDILFSRELLPIPTFSRFPFNFCQETGEGWTGDSNPIS